MDLDFLVLLEVVLTARGVEVAAGEDFRCVDAAAVAGAVPGWPIGHVALGEF